MKCASKYHPLLERKRTLIAVVSLRTGSSSRCCRDSRIGAAHLQPVAATAAQMEFAQRVIVHVRGIILFSHPIASGITREVREYLLAQSAALGRWP
jgi:hypothetical protein